MVSLSPDITSGFMNSVLLGRKLLNPIYIAEISPRIPSPTRHESLQRRGRSVFLHEFQRNKDRTRGSDQAGTKGKTKEHRARLPHYESNQLIHT